MTAKADLEEAGQIQGPVLQQDEVRNLVVRLWEALELLQHLSGSGCLLLLPHQDLLLLLYLHFKGA